MDFIAKIVAQLDTTKADEDLKRLTKNQNINLGVNKIKQAELSKITKQLSSSDNFKINVSIKKSSLTAMKTQIQTYVNGMNIDLSKGFNLNKLESSLTNLGNKYGRQFADNFNKGFNNNSPKIDMSQVFNTKDLDKQKKLYMQKVSNTIEAQQQEINALAQRQGWQKVDITGIEQADGYIKSLTLTVRDAEGALKKFNFQRAKLQGSGKAQSGLMQVGDVSVLETASQASVKQAQKDAEKQHKESVEREKKYINTVNKERARGRKQELQANKKHQETIEKNRQRVLKHSKKMVENVDNALSKYNLGDNKELSAWREYVNKGVSAYGNGDLTDVDRYIEEINKKTQQKIAALRNQHEAIEKEKQRIAKEEQLLENSRREFYNNDAFIERQEKEQKANSLKHQRAFEELFKVEEIDNYEEAIKRIESLESIDSSKYFGSKNYEKLKEQLNEINRLKKSIDDENKKDFVNFDKVNSDLKEMNSLLNKAETTYRNLSTPISTLEAQAASNKTLTWLKENTKAAKEYGDTLQNLAEKQKNATTVGELQKYSNEFKNITAEAKQKGAVGKSIFGEAKRAFLQIAEFTSFYAIIQNVVEEIPRQMINAVYEIDTAMVELQKVTDMSKNQLSSYFDEAVVSAKKYGATINEVINTTSDWVRLGYNLNDAKVLSDATTLLQKVGDDMTQEASSEGMISALQGFQIDPSDVMHIVDAYNEVSNRFAIGTDGIADAVSRSASSMYAAGNTMEETIGLITAANTVVQDPASVGTAFKTISMRIRGAKTELEDAGLETEGMVESTAKLREEIIALSGVDIMLDKNTFKSTYQILEELSNKWSELTDIQQASVTELIAGKRQGNIVSSLMANFSIAEEATMAATDSSGSAEKELQNYQKGLEYSVDKFKAAFQELSSITLDSDFLKTFVDMGTGAIEVLSTLIEKFDSLHTVIGLVGGLFAQHKGLGRLYCNLLAPSYKVT